MGEATKIEWADHSFNPWVGCTKVSPACDHCYAEGWAKRTGHPELWQGERRRTTAENWREPIKWNKRAAAAGRRDRVFCASMADIFDNQVPDQWRWDLWELIGRTRHLDWLLLTKRPQNIAKMLPVMDSNEPGYRPWNQRWPWPNVWLGTTVENQAEADRRIPHLLSVPAAVRFLSCEPLLGPIDLGSLTEGAESLNALTGLRDNAHSKRFHGARVDWVIAGGESGPGARPSHPDWLRSLRDQCQAAGVAFHFKQWGEWCEPLPGEPFNTAHGRAGRPPAFIIGSDGTVHCFAGPQVQNGKPVVRVGKKLAGAMLDGREWREMPR